MMELLEAQLHADILVTQIALTPYFPPPEADTVMDCRCQGVKRTH